MYNRGSCRGCGRSLTALSICIACREDVSWVCGGCGRGEDAVHSHNLLLCRQ
ncbi:MAG TPA: hypothetical protein VD736_01375 [Nitrososphaera sp.]|nr:hypothetical protein [Nitrososphaera sp.]